MRSSRSAHQAPCAGLGAPAISQHVGLKALETGSVVDRTFRAGEKFARVHTEVKNVQFLYDDGSEAHFMDEETFDVYYGPLLVGRLDGRKQRFQAAETVVPPPAAEREHFGTAACTTP